MIPRPKLPRLQTHHAPPVARDHERSRASRSLCPPHTPPCVHCATRIRNLMRRKMRNRASSPFIQEKWTRRSLEHKSRVNRFERTGGRSEHAGRIGAPALAQLNTLFRSGVAGPLSDDELLQQFVAGADESAEAAFAALVDRHGAMVLGVCRRVLGNRHAAEDAFQATFLVLSRKAPEIARREQLAGWLYGVARRAALDARARASRRRANEKRLRIMTAADDADEIQMTELRSILDEELGRLPERHRAALILCELEGLSRREAAGRLGVSEGTLSSRLARAKMRLRERLTRRGLALSSVALATALTQDIQALSVPPSLVDSTIHIAAMVATSSSLAEVASTSIVTLTEGVLKAMLLSKLKLAFLGVITVAILATGAGVVAQDRPSDNDRLRNLERKVDRLLEVLGGAGRRTTTSPAQNSTPESNEPAPVVASTPAAPAAPAAIAAVPPPPVAPAMPAAAPAPAATPQPEVLANRSSHTTPRCTTRDGTSSSSGPIQLAQSASRHARTAAG